MFALWYSVLSWREYRDVLCAKLNPNCPSKAKNAAPPPPPSPVAKPTPPPATAPIGIAGKKDTTSRIPVIEPPKARTPSPKPTTPIPQTPPPKSPTPTPTTPIKPPSSPLSPPAQPPRSPSPHPINTEAFDGIDLEEYISDEEEDDGDDEEEESVIDAKRSPWTVPVKKSVSPQPPKQAAGNFLAQEINQQQTQFKR